MAFNRETAVYFAILADKTKSYEDVVGNITRIAKETGELTEVEWTLLYKGYKNMIQPRRDSWKYLSSKLETESNQTNKDQIRGYQKVVEGEMSDICENVMSILDHLVPSCKPEDNPTTAVLCNKMKGDFHMYLAEVTSGDEWKQNCDESLKAYQSAMVTAMKLPPVNHLRLGVALNFSVFQYKIYGLHERACEIAEKALKEASSFGDLNLEVEKESTRIIQLLKDMVELWKPKK